MLLKKSYEIHNNLQDKISNLNKLSFQFTNVKFQEKLYTTSKITYFRRNIKHIWNLLNKKKNYLFKIKLLK